MSFCLGQRDSIFHSGLWIQTSAGLGKERLYPVWGIEFIPGGWMCSVLWTEAWVKGREWSCGGHHWVGGQLRCAESRSQGVLGRYDRKSSLKMPGSIMGSFRDNHRETRDFWCQCQDGLRPWSYVHGACLFLRSLSFGEQDWPSDLFSLGLHVIATAWFSSGSWWHVGCVNSEFLTISCPCLTAVGYEPKAQLCREFRATQIPSWWRVTVSQMVTRLTTVSSSTCSSVEISSKRIAVWN